MIRRPPRSTLSSSSAASDVYKRQFQNLAPFVSYYETTKSVNAFNLLISFFKLFKFCKLSGTINVLWLTLTESSKYLFGYVIMLFLVLFGLAAMTYTCLLYTSPSPRDRTRSRMPSSA
eukprot:TRINITY_DN3953_c0_g2_i3.p1 TRINITY_DN3953_c0_g2~~TRINITY_DN3953_c0_g2_i3.p1  ORF type:complete len:118 (+),score=36.39 TRINITY_DN3953_c0_g2_i3:112-465(+)